MRTTFLYVGLGSLRNIASYIESYIEKSNSGFISLSMILFNVACFAVSNAEQLVRFTNTSLMKIAGKCIKF